MRTNTFDDRTAIFLAAICFQTYEQYSNPVGAYVIPEFYEEVSTFLARSITGQSERFGFIIESTDHIIIAFRGTSSTTDWISDAIAKQAKYKCVKDAGLSHVGISNIYYSARDQILSSLKRLSKEKDLIITGHSLGGALAALCAVDVAGNSEFSNPNLYTYGAPRVGDPIFAKVFSNTVGQSYRVNNRFDVVPQLPPHIYKLPRRVKTYRYMHVREDMPLHFHKGSVSGNHVISSYFNELTKRNPIYAEQLNKRNPGLCPQILIYSS
ncbi:lipase family protein [Cohnella sp.]|uniref:lipase family protein n=1 Tax=Cohnella sp. TaxID=1883426 RepID=UPI0035629191